LLLSTSCLNCNKILRSMKRRDAARPHDIQILQSSTAVVILIDKDFSCFLLLSTHCRSHHGLKPSNFLASFSFAVFDARFWNTSVSWWDLMVVKSNCSSLQMLPKRETKRCTGLWIHYAMTNLSKL
jgi:hypothetical protein